MHIQAVAASRHVLPGQFAAVSTHLYCNIAGAPHRMRFERHSITAEVVPEAHFATRRRCTKFLGSLLNVDYDASSPAKSRFS
jgi:hypothetical protein